MLEMFPRYPVELFYIPAEDDSGKLPENAEKPVVPDRIPERRQPYVYDIDIVLPLKKN